VHHVDEAVVHVERLEAARQHEALGGIGGLSRLDEVGERCGLGSTAS
jgi:hypothetical protein